MIDYSRYKFHPVVHLPEKYAVYDFSKGFESARPDPLGFGIGRYDEDRQEMYTAPIFQNAGQRRTVHMGIDIGAPAGTPVHAFYPGDIFLLGYNGAPGDYGFTLITRHLLGEEYLFALYGHLSTGSIEGKSRGQLFDAGEKIACIGDRHENGGWMPHLHFQLSLVEPSSCDMPGVVSLSQREEAKRIYPDPRLILGPLY